MAERKEELTDAQRIGRLGWFTVYLGPGLTFWLWSAYQVYAFGTQVAGRNINAVLDYSMMWPYRSGYSTAGTLLAAVVGLVIGIYLWLSTLVSVPIAAVIIGGLYFGLKVGLALIEWAKTSVVGAGVVSLLALSAAYFVFFRSGTAGATWRGFELVVGSVAARFGLGRRKSGMSTEQEQQTEAALRKSMEVLQGEIQSIGVEVPAVPAASGLWGGWIDTVTRRVQLERQTKVATSALEHLKVVNDCYREWKDYHLLRQDIEGIEATKTISKKKQEIELQELELKRTLEHQVNKSALENKLKQQERDRAKLDAEIAATRAKIGVQPESPAERVLRGLADDVKTLERLATWEQEMIAKYPDRKDEIAAMADSRRTAILESR